jgi:intracellular sulfur oxidation DsrE/DsrF family protein
MRKIFSSLKLATATNRGRRRLITALAATTGLAALGGHSSVRAAEKKELDELRFPGDEPEHKIVYQFNKAEPDYHNHVLFSVGAVLRKYGDNVKIVVVCFGPGIHILAKQPLRPVSNEIRERVSSLADYGVEFHACGNTMKSLQWTENDIVSFAKHVEVGAADLMELQEQGYSYISW